MFPDFRALFCLALVLPGNRAAGKMLAGGVSEREYDLPLMDPDYDWEQYDPKKADEQWIARNKQIRENASAAGIVVITLPSGETMDIRLSELDTHIKKAAGEMEAIRAFVGQRLEVPPVRTFDALLVREFLGHIEEEFSQTQRMPWWKVKDLSSRKWKVKDFGKPGNQVSLVLKEEGQDLEPIANREEPAPSRSYVRVAFEGPSAINPDTAAREFPLIADNGTLWFKDGEYDTEADVKEIRGWKSAGAPKVRFDMPKPGPKYWDGSSKSASWTLAGKLTEVPVIRFSADEVTPLSGTPGLVDLSTPEALKDASRANKTIRVTVDSELVERSRAEDAAQERRAAQRRAEGAARFVPRLRGFPELPMLPTL